jgi:type IV pilus assembly protein PilW
MLTPSSSFCRTKQSGFTIVEIMVGLAIGMLASIVIMQVFSQFETQKRTSTGTSDAQTNGSIALFTLSRDLQQAGYPLITYSNSPLKCTTLKDEGVDANINRLAPVTIVDGIAAVGINASDSITLRYGTSTMGGIPANITAIASPTPNDVTVANHFGCLVGDKVLITNVTACALTTVDATSAVATPPATITLRNMSVVATGSTLACLGTWNEITYALNNGNLERNGVPIVVGIVNLQAQYGISAAGLVNTDPNFNQITQWVNASGSWATPSVTDRNRIKAVRIALIARNSKIESSAVSSACSSINSASPTGVCAWEGNLTSPAPSVDLSNGNALPDWAQYRYRVFEIIVPLRNVIWSKDSL